MRIIPASDSSLMIEFGDSISPEFHHQVVASFAAVKALGNSLIRNLHPAYASLLIDFDPLLISHLDLKALLEPLIASAASSSEVSTRTVDIPVCYGHPFGLDLEEVARLTGLSEQQVIERHSSVNYTVNFLGFSPGFAYLGGLDVLLQVPRLASPRRLVKAGTVAIAGAQTGIYPIDSPGGWRLIGSTPLTMFNSAAEPPARLQPGDRVRFLPISSDEFDALAVGLKRVSK